MKTSIIICLSLISSISFTQVNEVLLDPNGIVFPRMNNAQRNALSPVQGHCIYNTQSKALECYDGTSWSTPSSSGTTSLLVDNDGDTYIDLEKTPDDDIISFTSQGVEVMKHDGQTLHITNNGQSVFVGENAGVADDLSNNRNTFVGSLSGQANTAGSQNVAVGHQALKDNITGSNNIAVGQQALQKNKSSNNIAIGFNAARDNNNGVKNIAIGGYSGFINQLGNENTFIGYEAGRNTATSTSGSVMIGHQAGMNETANNRLYIANDNTTSPLIYGEFDNQKVVIHGDHETNGNHFTNGNHEITGEAKIGAMVPATATAQPVAREADGTLSVMAANTSPTYAVGDFAQGGVVFWMSTDGKHGKVVSIYDHVGVKWSNVTNTYVGLSAQNDRHGAGNTVAIMMQDGHTTSAAKFCADLTYSGYDDWYLPSTEELSLVRGLQTTINSTALSHGGQNFVSSSLYWSSEETDFNPGQAWSLRFDCASGCGQSGSKGASTAFRTRAIRSFSID